MLTFVAVAFEIASTSPKLRKVKKSQQPTLSRRLRIFACEKRDTLNQHRRVLVTGAAGFIGFHVSKALGQLDDFVIGIDNFNQYYDTSLKKHRAKILSEQLGIQVHEIDINNGAALELLNRQYEFTHVLHLAAQAGVGYSIRNPSSYVESNVQGFVSLLESLKNSCSASNIQYPVVVYASSSSVYGRNRKIPFSEKDQIIQPSSMYAATKISNELIAHVYHSLYGFKMTGLRYFTVYGPWGRPDMAYFLFAEAIYHQKELYLYVCDEEAFCADSSAFLEPSRDFTYIEDIVNGTISALSKGCDLEVVNLGHHRPQKISVVVDHIERFLGRKSFRKYKPLPKGDVPHTFADISKARELLGYEPVIELEKGLEAFCKWYLWWKQGTSGIV
eukprot:jgi/Galph1/5987/GphlegSOOS_G4615.1